MTLTYARSLAGRATALGCAVALAAGFATAPALAQPETDPAPPPAPAIGIELNRLLNNVETGACTGTFVIYNRRSEPLAQLTVEIILWGRDGIIVDRLALGFTAIRVGDTAPRVALFDLATVPCDDLARITVNDVTSCRSLSAVIPNEECLLQIGVASRVSGTRLDGGTPMPLPTQ